MPNLYDPQVVKKLFDEMAGTYGWMNMVTSFGFARRWRRQCLRLIPIPPGGHAIDLMTGMGELCPDLCSLLGGEGSIVALDLSEAMSRRAAAKTYSCPVSVVQADVLTYDFAPASADVVVSSFGVKTFSAEQIAALAKIVAHVLKPGGVFSFVEISVPPFAWLKWPYMFYLNQVIPRLGALFLGNPDNYHQLGIYTAAFQNCRQAWKCFERAGLETRFHSFFFGCATGISGRQPDLSTRSPDSAMAR